MDRKKAKIIHVGTWDATGPHGWVFDFEYQEYLEDFTPSTDRDQSLIAGYTEAELKAIYDKQQKIAKN